MAHLTPFAAEKRGDAGGGRPSPLHEHASTFANETIIPTWMSRKTAVLVLKRTEMFICYFCLKQGIKINENRIKTETLNMHHGLAMNNTQQTLTKLYVHLRVTVLAFARIASRSILAPQYVSGLGRPRARSTGLQWSRNRHVHLDQYATIFVSSA